MKNWNPIICSVLGALAYIANSALLPDWSHFLVGVFTGLVFVAAYWLVSSKLRVWIRVSIATAIAIGAGAIVSFAFDLPGKRVYDEIHPYCLSLFVSVGSECV